MDRDRSERAGKTTLLQVAATLVHPTKGSVEVLGERLGDVNVFDLRPRIGLTSAALAERVQAGEKVIDLVLTASYAILGRWKEEYESADVTRAVRLLDALGCAHLIRRRFSTLSEGERKRVQIARAMMPIRRCCCSTSPPPGSTWAAATCCGGCRPSPRRPAGRRSSPCCRASGACRPRSWASASRRSSTTAGPAAGGHAPRGRSRCPGRTCRARSFRSSPCHPEELFPGAVAHAVAAFLVLEVHGLGIARSARA